MVTVTVKPAGDAWHCDVTVEQAGERTQHQVTVTAAELARWGRGSGEEAVRRLVERSFDFLLEREPPSAILRQFELSVIERYFPEYEHEITARG